MKRLPALITILLLLAAAPSLKAQEYEQAVGLRFGYPTSVSYKFFPGGSGNAIEAFAGYRGSNVVFSIGRRGWRHVNIGALYQIHQDVGIDEIPGLQWYYGGGGSVYLWNYDEGFINRDNYSNITLGLHGVIGLDYAFEDVPINLSFDWMPTIVIGSSLWNTFRGDYGALSVRYVLGR